MRHLTLETFPKQKLKHKVIFKVKKRFQRKHKAGFKVYGISNYRGSKIKPTIKLQSNLKKGTILTTIWLKKSVQQMSD